MEIARLRAAEIDALIHSSSFHEAKARQIRVLAERTVREFEGALPEEAEVLQSFAAVGPMCAHLTLASRRGCRASASTFTSGEWSPHLRGVGVCRQFGLKTPR